MNYLEWTVVEDQPRVGFRNEAERFYTLGKHIIYR